MTFTKGLVMEMEGKMFGAGNERRSQDTASLKEGLESIQSKLNILSGEQNAPFLTSFVVELIHRVSNTLRSIRNYTQISRGKFSDREFGEYYFRAVTEDIEKMDMVLNSLLDYVKVHTPIRKTNTIHKIIDEALKKHEDRLNEKGIKIFKKYESDLPEIMVPDEQLKYLVNSALQYAMALTPPHWTIGLSTRSFILENETVDIEDLFKRDGRVVEISVVFAGHQRPDESGRGTAAVQKEDAPELILRFIKEVVVQNRGIIKMGTDEKRTKSYISLRFPVERRKIVYYESGN